MNVNEILKLKESLLDCLNDYPVILSDGNRDPDVDKIIAVIGNWYKEEVKKKLPVDLE